MPEYLASCCFLDVGQGTSQVILLGDNRAIIVDTGSKRTRNESPLIILLRQFKIQTIELLVLSHNDSDHIGDAKSVFDEFQQKIKYVLFLDDRPSNNNNALSVINNAIVDGYLNRNHVRRLESGLNNDLFSEKGLTVSVIFPDFLTNLENTRNNTNAVIALSVGSQKVIFSGDAPVAAWKSIVNNNGKQSLQILTVPHHGGSFAEKKKDVKWFFDNVKTNYAIVSVGSRNTYGHPKTCVIQSFVKNNTDVLCTQSTSQCGKIGTCCGTIVADLSYSSTVIRNLADLQEKKQQVSQRLCQV